MIEELLDKYHVDDFDDLLIEIIKRMKERKEEERRKKVEQKQQVKQEEPPPFEPDPNSVSILKQDLTDDQMRDLSRDEYLMVQIPTQISKFIDAQDANTWLNKNSKLLETIKQNYSADYKIISTLFNKKLDDLEGVNNG